jgi:predicted AAA+ superfamily ATPase
MHPDRGRIFECFIVADMLKTRLNAGLSPDLYFWRDNLGNEVDVVYEDGTSIHAVEIKSGKTITPEFISGLETWMRYSGEKPKNSFLIYGGDLEMTMKGIKVRKWDSTGIL